jgi:hypothetical protein
MVKALDVDIGEEEDKKGFFFGHHQVEWPGAISRTATGAGPSEPNNKKEGKGKKTTIFSMCVCAQNRIIDIQSVVVRGMMMKGANQKEVNKPKGANEPPVIRD